MRMEENGSFLDGSPDVAAFLGSDPARLSFLMSPQGNVLPNVGGERGPSRLGLIDSGVNPDHPQLAGVIALSRSFTDAPAEDALGHGTSVAIALALASPASRITVANVRSLKGQLKLEAVIAALEWMAALDMRVVNMSLGFTGDGPGVQRLRTAIARLERDAPRMMVVAASGNLDGVKHYPAACGTANVIAVGQAQSPSGPSDVIGEKPIRLTWEEYRRAVARDGTSKGGGRKWT